MLQLHAVRKSYVEPGGRLLPILDVPQFAVAAGQQVVLVGPSGCGKTTLLHVIAGITRPDAGQVLIGGIDVAALSEAARDHFRAQNIGYVFQTFNLLPGFSALENVLLGMTFSGQGASRQRAAELLARVGLAERMSHKPMALSVGEQQRVAVARSLANRPKLLLADEPTANVDSGNQQQIIDLIREGCRAENIALLLVTHAPEVARQFEHVVELATVNKVGRGQTEVGSRQ